MYILHGIGGLYYSKTKNNQDKTLKQQNEGIQITLNLKTADYVKENLKKIGTTDSIRCVDKFLKQQPNDCIL